MAQSSGIISNVFSLPSTVNSSFDGNATGTRLPPVLLTDAQWWCGAEGGAALDAHGSLLGVLLPLVYSYPDPAVQLQLVVNAEALRTALQQQQKLLPQ